MLLIYSPSHTSRLEYILQLLLSEMLGVSWKLTTDQQEFNLSDGPKLAYTPGPWPEGLYIEACGLLFETSIFPHDPRVTNVEGLPVLFASDDPASALPFDPFAASFCANTSFSFRALLSSNSFLIVAALSAKSTLNCSFCLFMSFIDY